jgi:hypothetical protein
MVRLELSDEDVRELSDALAAQLHGLRFELSAADVRQFKHDLRERLERLERIAARLAGATGETGEQPIAG